MESCLKRGRDERYDGSKRLIIFIFFESMQLANYVLNQPSLGAFDVYRLGR
jgi:hypothetical protein